VDFVFNLAENFADLVFERVRADRLLLEAVQIREQLLVDELDEVGAGDGDVVVELAVFTLRRGQVSQR